MSDSASHSRPGHACAAPPTASATASASAPDAHFANGTLVRVRQLSRRLNWYWFITLGLLVLVGLVVVVLDLTETPAGDAGGPAGTNRWNMLIGLIGSIMIFALYMTLKRSETERLKSDLIAQRDMATRIETRTSELEGAIEQLTAIDRMKDSFLSTVSHEIRTPLTAIQSYSEVLLARADASPEIRTEFLGIINREARRLAVLINDLQDLARLEAGRVALHTTPCALAPLLEEAIETTAILAREKGLDLSSDIPANLPPVQVDPHRVVRVFTNLLGNAVKFTPRGESIHLSARIETRETRDGGVSAGNGGGAFVRVSVRDRGRGIQPADLPHVFERFFRGAADGSHVQGTGLGLAISKEIVDRLGGEIWVESTVGKGSVFHALLPAASAVADPIPAAAIPSGSAAAESRPNGNLVPSAPGLDANS